MSTVAPSGLGEQLETYGEDGSCWKGSAEQAAICDEACRNAMAEQRTIDPNVTACWECESDGDCQVHSEPRCGADHRCVECTENAHCADPEKPSCSVKGTCAEAPQLSAQCFTEWTGGSCDAACLEQNDSDGLCAESFNAAFGPGGPCDPWDICCETEDLGTSPECGFAAACEETLAAPHAWWECLFVACCMPK